MLRELRAALARAEAAEDVNAVVLTGAGSSFCAGLDLDDVKAGEGILWSDMVRQPPWMPLTKPIIAAVNGPAVTGGLELVLWCDFAIAGRSASFQDTHAVLEVMPGWGMSALLSERVGAPRALQMTLTGERVGAVEALAWGLVNRVVEDAAVLDTAIGLAATVVSGAGRNEVVHVYREQIAARRRLALATEIQASKIWTERARRSRLTSLADENC
jgi:enoyl-CoA hydratase